MTPCLCEKRGGLFMFEIMTMVEEGDKHDKSLEIPPLPQRLSDRLRMLKRTSIAVWNCEVHRLRHRFAAMPLHVPAAFAHFDCIFS